MSRPVPEVAPDAGRERGATDNREGGAGRSVVGVAVTLGLIGNLLLRVDGVPGLNMALWALAVAAGALLLRRRLSRAPAGESLMLLAAGVLLVSAMAWRDAPQLKVLSLLSGTVAFALAAFRPARVWLAESSVTLVLMALVTGWLHGALGVVRLLRPAEWATSPAGTTHGARPGRGWRTAGAAVRGAALALPMLLVFGGLFMSADAVFATMVTDVVVMDLDVLVSHIALTLVLGWFAAGYITGYVRSADVGVASGVPSPPRLLGITEVGVALGLVQVLFVLFLAVQFRYLFGGSGLVEVTPGLTYAEYARRGFFELVVVTALVLPLLLAMDAMLRREGPSDDIRFRVLAGIQLALVAAIMVSAVHRLRMYVGSYGLTEQRFYAAALLITLALVLAWFALTVLRGRPRRFAVGLVTLGLAAVAALHVANPDAVIARTNVARAVDATIVADPGGADDPGAHLFDAGYARNLSADAVPVLLAALPQLPASARCALAGRMLERWGADAALDWRNWNLSVARARRLVQTQAEALERAAACPAVAAASAADASRGWPDCATSPAPVTFLPEPNPGENHDRPKDTRTGCQAGSGRA